jgi:hypothetical protein
MDPPLLFAIRAGGLRVRLPASARVPGPGPAAEQAGPPRLASLVRVASGRSPEPV